MREFKYIGLSVALFCVGCASTGVKNQNQDIQNILDQEVGSVDRDLAERIMAEPRPYRLEKRKKKPKAQAQVQIENEIHQRVWWWIRYYTVRERDLFERALERGENYKPLVSQILKQYQLPGELYYLALIESGFVTQSTSHAEAVGIWQFMKPTAQQYGLLVAHSGGSVRTKVDERLHPIAATHAAAKYLAFLHKKFKTWYLAIAAYNAGQGRISEAIRQGHTHDFWTLAEKGLLPQETIDYIPKFLAAATIGEHSMKFGFHLSTAQAEWPKLAAVQFKKGKVPLTASEIAFVTNLDTVDLLRFNPQLNKLLKSPKGQVLRLWLPQKVASDFIQRSREKGWGQASLHDGLKSFGG